MKAPQSWGMWRSPRLALVKHQYLMTWWVHEYQRCLWRWCRARVLCPSCGILRWATVRPPTGLHHTTLQHFTQTDTMPPAGQRFFYLNMHVSLTIIYIKMYTSMHSFMRWIRSNCQYSSLLKKDMLSKQPFRQIRYLQISNDVARNMDIDITLVRLR